MTLEKHVNLIFQTAFFLSYIYVYIYFDNIVFNFAQSTEAIKYTDCFSAEG